MNASTTPAAVQLSRTLWERLLDAPVASALAALTQANQATVAAAVELAQRALAEAEAAPEQATHWLAIGAELNRQLGDDVNVQGWLAYAQARLYVQSGNLALAETALRAAQRAWQASGDQLALARSHLGLTQLFAIQGRYDAAEAANREAITQLQPLAENDGEAAVQLAGAYNNLANLLVYQEQHSAALTEIVHARQLLEHQLAITPEPAMQDALWRRLADVQVNQANALMSLDDIYAAEALLHSAINPYDRLNDPLNRARARTNLGSLHLRTGRYAAALSHFDLAARDLLGDAASWDDLPASQAQNADVLLLDQANAYLALNLLAEAAEALERSISLLRNADRPHELGQALLTLGLLRLRTGATDDAAALLHQAQQLFFGLDNPFWLNRIAIALAGCELQQQTPERAKARLDTLLAQLPTSDWDVATQAAPLQWDINSFVEAHLLRLRLHLADGQTDQARQCAAAIASAIGVTQSDLPPKPGSLQWPHLHLRWRHALGLIEQVAGNTELAGQHLRAAIALLEAQRVTLPVEEIRTAFLDDKSVMYADLVLYLLDQPGEQAVQQAFDVAEQARARTLLERLLSHLAGEPADEQEAPLASRRRELQERLHWLYNQMLGDVGSRRTDPALSHEIHACEAALQQLAWRQPAPLAEAEPITVSALQRTLAPDQQAVVYFNAGGEVLAFVVSRETVQIFRHLCTVSALEQAQARWRYELARAEMGEPMLARHAQSYQRAWRGALSHLYQLVLAPLASALRAPRLLVIPHGALHQTPFQALWDGRQLLLERYELTYAPSATLAVHTHDRRRPESAWRRLAALALTDPAIPAARQEVEAAARCFSHAQPYLDDAASLANLEVAAAEADVLHIATHGRFRPDNPFFSLLKLADGWVDVRRLYRLPLAARLVVLSACESGAGQARGGDEVIGVARGFLAAGASSLIASLWNVHDASSAKLMERFYSALTASGAAVRPAAALRRAQLEAVQEGRHPFYWASFFVIGE